MKIIPAQIQAVIKADLLPAHGEDKLEYLADDAIEALVDRAPEIVGWEAEQDVGAYPVLVRGVPGAYFIQAAERDDDGVYTEAAEAISIARAKYGEFFI